MKSVWGALCRFGSRAWSGKQGKSRYKVLRRVCVVLVSIVLAVLLVVVADVVAVFSHIKRLDIPQFTSNVQGTTWVVVGSDNVSDVPSDLDYPSKQTGDHADIILIIHQTDQGFSILSVPRDLYVTPQSGDSFTPDRLTGAMNQSPAAFTSALCSNFGVPTDHLVMFHFNTFESIVNAVGGVTVNVPYPTREQLLGLSLNAGDNHLDGSDALSWVRMRTPEQLVNGQWQPESNEDGVAHRTGSAGPVVSQVSAKMRSQKFNPLLWQRLVWSGTQGLAFDRRTSLQSLRTLMQVSTDSITDVPGQSTDSPIVLFPDDDTTNAFARAGYSQGDCSVKS